MESRPSILECGRSSCTGAHNIRRRPATRGHAGRTVGDFTNTREIAGEDRQGRPWSLGSRQFGRSLGGSVDVHSGVERESVIKRRYRKIVQGELSDMIWTGRQVPVGKTRLCRGRRRLSVGNVDCVVAASWLAIRSMGRSSLRC